MFKSILPTKKISDSDFTIVTPLGDSAANGKENLPHPLSAPHANGKASIKSSKPMLSDKYKGKKIETRLEGEGMEQAFDRLLVSGVFLVIISRRANRSQDDLQIPSSLRPKLYGMEATVKEAMLKSSHQIVPPSATLEHPSTPPPPIRSIRRVQSGGSLNLESPRSQHLSEENYQTASRAAFGNLQHARGSSVDLFRPKSRNATSSEGTSRKREKSRGMTPVQYVSMLTGTSSLELDLEPVKKLRLMLRNEAAR